MPKFRKKPITIEAEQFRGFYATPYPAGVELEDNGNDPSQERYKFFVVTAHGQKTYVVPGDWIIPELDGRGHYPCKDDIFQATYQPVGDE